MVIDELGCDGDYPADLAVMHECENVLCRVEGRQAVRGYLAGE